LKCSGKKARQLSPFYGKLARLGLFVFLHCGSQKALVCCQRRDQRLPLLFLVGSKIQEVTRSLRFSPPPPAQVQILHLNEEPLELSLLEEEENSSLGALFSNWDEIQAPSPPLFEKELSLLALGKKRDSAQGSQESESKSQVSENDEPLCSRGVTAL
jgi:hypothetical protein